MPRIKKAFVRHISLVPRGANRLPVIYKSDDRTIDFDTILKADMEEGTITAIVYAPEHTDSQGDIASAEVIKEMAHEFAKNGEGIDIRHNGKVVPKDKAFIAESFIVQKGDARFSDTKDTQGNKVNTEGAWATIIKIDDEGLRKEYREGKWNGVSMGGTALVESEKDESSLAKQIVAALKSLFSQRADEGDIDMKPEELKKALDEQATTIATAVATAMTDTLTKAGIIKKEEKPDPNDKPQKKAPEFKGDINKEEDRKAHRKALAIWKAQTEHADDPVAEFEAIEKIHKEYAVNTTELDAAAGVKEDDSDEVKELRRRLHKAEKASNQPGTSGEPNSSMDQIIGISKEDAELLSAASKFTKDHYKAASGA